MIAFVYAGQGSQRVGMGLDFYRESPDFAAAFDQAQETLGLDLRDLCFRGPEERLARTRYTQPCMAAFAAGVTDLLSRAGIRPQAAAGLSLGEYSALYAAGALDRTALLRTVALRGRAMEASSAGLDCAMTAVLGLDRAALEEICARAGTLGVVQVCNCNCPGQIAIGGERAAVDRAAELARAAGARRCVPLKVSGPFHTRLMRPAGDALAEHFRIVPFHSLEIPVYFNCTGGPLGPGDTIPALLERQVQSPVLWEDTIRRMAADGVDTVVEIGPGKVLSGFFKRTAPQIRTCHIDTAEDFRAVVSALGGA